MVLDTSYSVLGESVELAEVSQGALPHVVHIQPAFYSSIVQGTWITVAGASYHSGGWQNSTNADADEITYDIFLPQGTYKFHLMHGKDNASGILDIEIDSVSIGTLDLYNGTTQYNQLSSISSVNVTSSGDKTITLKLNGKNASSSNHYATIQLILFERTGDST